MGFRCRALVPPHTSPPSTLLYARSQTTSCPHGVGIFGHAAALHYIVAQKCACAAASTTTRQEETIQFAHCRSTAPLFSYSRTRNKRTVVNAVPRRVAQPDALR